MWGISWMCRETVAYWEVFCSTDLGIVCLCLVAVNCRISLHTSLPYRCTCRRAVFETCRVRYIPISFLNPDATGKNTHLWSVPDTVFDTSLHSYRSYISQSLNHFTVIVHHWRIYWGRWPVEVAYSFGRALSVNVALIMVDLFEYLQDCCSSHINQTK